MFSLRDLINNTASVEGISWSQLEETQSPSVAPLSFTGSTPWTQQLAPSSLPPTFTQKSVKSSVKFLRSSDTESESDGGEAGLTQTSVKSSQATSRNLGSMPGRRTHNLDLYAKSPELKYTTRYSTGKDSTGFVPSMPTYLRFSQSESSVLLRQKQVVREVARRAAEAQDFECAAYAMYTQGQIDSIGFADFVRFAELLQVSPQADALIRFLRQIITNQASHKMPTSERQDVMFVMLQLLCGRGDLEGARKLKQQSWFAEGNSASGLLTASFLVMSSSGAVALVDSIFEMHYEGPLVGVENRSLQRSALDLIWVMQALGVFARSQWLPKPRLDELQQLQKDILEAVETLRGSQLALEWPDVQRLVLCALVGSGARRHAGNHAKLVLQHAREISTERPREALELLRVVADLVIVLSPTSTMESTALATLLDLRGHMHLLQAPPPLLGAWILFELRRLSAAEFAEELADLVECMEEPGSQTWLSWRMLAACLGKLPALGDDDPIEPRSDILDRIPEMAVLGGRALSFGPRRAPRHADSDGCSDAVRALREQRTWWTDSVLSAAALGEFESALLPSQLQEVLVALEQVPPLALPALTPRAQTLLTHPLRRHAQHMQQRIAPVLSSIDEDELEGGGEDPPETVDLSRIFGALPAIASEDEMAWVTTLCLDDEAVLLEAYTALHPGRDKAEAFATQMVNIAGPLTRLGLPAALAKNEETLRVVKLGAGALEVLACQALVAAHLSSADHLFVVRAVQVLATHAVLPAAAGEGHPSAHRCLRWLRDCGLNLMRCYRLGLDLTYRGLELRSAPPPIVCGPTDADAVSAHPGARR